MGFIPGDSEAVPRWRQNASCIRGTIWLVYPTPRAYPIRFEDVIFFLFFFFVFFLFPWSHFSTLSTGRRAEFQNSCRRKMDRRVLHYPRPSSSSSSPIEGGHWKFILLGLVSAPSERSDPFIARNPSRSSSPSRKSCKIWQDSFQDFDWGNIEIDKEKKEEEKWRKQ